MSEEIKVLCVDDEQNVLNSLKRLFLDTEYTFLTAASGHQGLEIMEREDAQIVISDYRMPQMNGIEFLKKVCTQWPDTVRIVLSGYADSASIVEAINEGQIYKFIPKPWNDDELKVTVANAVERFFLYKRNQELTAELTKKNEELLNLNAQLNRLLEQKSANLEFRTEILMKHQNILDALPIGILGLDPNNVAVLCNQAWVAAMGSSCCPIGEGISTTMSQDFLEFIETVKRDHKATRRVNINGITGRLLGASMDDSDTQEGILIVFIGDDNAA